MGIKCGKEKWGGGVACTEREWKGPGSIPELASFDHYFFKLFCLFNESTIWGHDVGMCWRRVVLNGWLLTSISGREVESFGKRAQSK